VKLAVIYKSRAQRDVKSAIDWYQSQRAGLGLGFLICLEAAEAKIQQQSELYPIVHANFRRILLQRFPYSVIYLIEKRTIFIFSVFDNRQDPHKLP
jgi:plasmid stabilization system protein ParE